MHLRSKSFSPDSLTPLRQSLLYHQGYTTMSRIDGHLRGLIEQYDQYLQVHLEKISPIDFSYGRLGAAWFYLQKFNTWNKTSDLEKFYSVIDSCLQDVQQSDDIVQQYIEFIELAFFFRHYSGILNKRYAVSTIVSQLEEILLPYLEKQLSLGHIDPFVGGFYPAWYLLHFSNNKDILATCIRNLEQQQRAGQSGGYYLYNKQMGYASLGITHGLAFYIIFLCKACERGILPDLCRTLIRAYVRFIRKQQYSADQTGCCYPDQLGKQGLTRLSATYGDPGIIYALSRAAETLGDFTLWKRALRQLHFSANRKTPVQTQVSDNGILYGRLGLFLFFQHTGQRLADKLLLKTASWWYDQLLDSLRQVEQLNPQPIEEYDYASMKIHSWSEGWIGILGTIMAIRNQDTLHHYLLFLK